MKKDKEVGLPEVEMEEFGEDENPNDPISKRILTMITMRWLLPRLLVVIFLIVLLVWIFQAEGGLGFEEATIFGLHALLMSLFAVVFTQEGVMAYSQSLLKFTRNRRVFKNFHICCHIMGMVCAVLGLVTIVYYKSLSPQPVVFPFYTAYSPHSWVGIALLSLWFIQMVVGTYSHIATLNPDQKRTFSRYHGFLGKFIYGLGLVTCAMGFQDMQSSDLASSTPPGMQLSSDMMSGMDSSSMTTGMDMMSGMVMTTAMDMSGMVMTSDMSSMMSSNMTDMMSMSGYFPNSPLAQYSSAGSFLLILVGLATFFNFIR